MWTSINPQSAHSRFVGTPGLHHRVRAHEVIPSTRRAHLYVVSGEISRIRTNAVHIQVRDDATSRRGKPRPENVEHLDQVLFPADWAQRLDRHTTLACIAHEFALSIANLRTGRLTGLVRPDGPLPSEPKVDRASGTVGKSVRHG